MKRLYTIPPGTRLKGTAVIAQLEQDELPPTPIGPLSDLAMRVLTKRGYCPELGAIQSGIEEITDQRNKADHEKDSNARTKGAYPYCENLWLKAQIQRLQERNEQNEMHLAVWLGIKPNTGESKTI